MDNCGVDRALVNHDGGDFSNPLESNEEMTAFCQASERLLPVWNILPPHTEMPLDDLLRRRMRDHGVAALRARPDAHRYLLNEVTMGTVLDELVDRRIPLFVNVEEGWQLLYDMLDSFPDLVLIATDHGCWGEDRLFRPLLERYRHFHVDTSRYELDGGLEDVVKTLWLTTDALRELLPPRARWEGHRCSYGMPRSKRTIARPSQRATWRAILGEVRL